MLTKSLRTDWVPASGDKEISLASDRVFHFRGQDETVGHLTMLPRQRLYMRPTDLSLGVKVVPGYLAEGNGVVGGFKDEIFDIAEVAQEAMDSIDLCGEDDISQVARGLLRLNSAVKSAYESVKQENSVLSSTDDQEWLSKNKLCNECWYYAKISHEALQDYSVRDESESSIPHEMSEGFMWAGGISVGYESASNNTSTRFEDVTKTAVQLFPRCHATKTGDLHFYAPRSKIDDSILQKFLDLHQEEVMEILGGRSVDWIPMCTTSKGRITVMNDFRDIIEDVARSVIAKNFRNTDLTVTRVDDNPLYTGIAEFT